MITNPAFSKSDNRPVLLRLAQHDGRVVRPWRDKGVARRLGGSVPVVVDRWEPPPFPHEVPRGEPGWSRPRAAGLGDVARVVLHDSTDAVWLDEVFDKGAPRIQVVSAGQVAQSRVLGGWCRLVGHRFIEVTVLEGSPLSGQSDLGASNDPMTVEVEQTDGDVRSFVLEDCVRLACRVCGVVHRDQVDRGPEMVRLHPTGAPLPPLVGAPLPPRSDPPWWLRLRLPWNPWGPANGVYVSVIAPVGVAGFVVVCFVTFGRDVSAVVPDWLLVTIAVAVVGDALLSTVSGYTRRFLERCGARFDSRHPFGDHPGNSALWTSTQKKAHRDRGGTNASLDSQGTAGTS